MRKVLLAMLCALSPAAALAQQGWQVTPTLSLSQVYDDQFLGPGAPASGGLLAVAAPRVGLLYGGERLELVANAAADLEMLESQTRRGVPYRRFSTAGLLSGRATERLTLSLSGSVLDSSSPRDISLITGLDQGLVHLQAGGTVGGLRYALSELVTASLDGGVNFIRQSGLGQRDLLVRANATGRFSARDTGRLQVLLRWFTVEGAPDSATSAVLAGGDRSLTEQLHFELLAGPRFTAGKLEGIEGSASLRWEQPRFLLGFVVSSTQGAVPGLIGLVDTASAALQFVLRPRTDLTLTAAPAAYLSWGAPLEAKVFELRLEATQAVTPWLSLSASYRFSAQDAAYTAVTATPNADRHHQLALGVSFRAPSSTDAAQDRARPIQRP